MVEEPEGPDLLGEAGRDDEGVAKRLQEVIFALQEMCHVQDEVHELCTGCVKCSVHNQEYCIFSSVHMTVISLKTLYGFSMFGYNGLNRHVVDARHQHQLQKSLQVRGWIALVCAVLRNPYGPMLLVHLSHHTLDQ